MLIVELLRIECHIRFAFCHWPAFDEVVSQEHRGRVADALRGDVYAFMNPSETTVFPRDYIALGDFNTEPFDELFETKLYAFRDRERSRQKPHYSDPDVRRVRLYNCGWRHLGEKQPHGFDVASDGHAGTYYQASKHIWRTYDQLLVTGGLLSEKPPVLDESQLFVRTDTGILSVDGKPRKFEFDNGIASGLSDHIPITGTIILS